MPSTGGETLEGEATGEEAKEGAPAERKIGEAGETGEAGEAGDAGLLAAAPNLSKNLLYALQSLSLYSGVSSERFAKKPLDFSNSRKL